MLSDPSEIVMLTMVAIAAVIATRIIRDVTSSARKRRYTRPVKYVLILSLSLGFVFSFFETAALLAAEIMALAILLLSLYFYLVGGWLTSHQNLRSFWIPSKTIKDWFFYLSLYNGVIGVVSGVLSVILPYFTSFEVPATIGTVYSGVSVLAALMEFTILLPDKSTICGLVYAFCFVTRRFNNSKEFYVEDIDFEKMITNTIHSEIDVRESLESLVKQGFAVKQSPTPMGRVRFKINVYGAKYLEVYWTETLIRISRQKERIEKVLTYVEHRSNNVNPDEVKIIVKALEELSLQKSKLILLREEYGLAVGDSWYNNAKKRIDWLESRFQGLKGVHPQVEAQSNSSGV